jgi:hypothetical protein
MADETKKKPAPKKEGKPGTKPEAAAAKSPDKQLTLRLVAKRRLLKGIEERGRSNC